MAAAPQRPGGASKWGRAQRALPLEPPQLRKMSSPPPPAPGPGGAEPPRQPPLSVRRQWEMSRAGAASGPAADAARRGLKVRNALTALSIGAVVVGIYAYTIHSISQERFLDELEQDAKVMQAQRAKPSAE